MMRSGQGALAAIKDLTPIIAPIVLALTGMMFLAGWTERQFLLLRFGLSEAMFAESFQVTLARGYIPLLLGLMAIAILLGIVWMLAKLENFFWRRVIVPALPKRNAGKVVATALEGISSYGRAIVVASAAVIMLTVAGIAGGVSGVLKHRHIVSSVDAGCRANCFTYQLETRRLTGIVVVQDAERTAIFGGGGLTLVENPKILLVLPSNL